MVAANGYCYLHGWGFTIANQVIIKSGRSKKWIEEQADENGYLPEQVPYHLNNEVYYPYWVNKWGNIAKPLLWSHAMYLVLDYELKKAGVQLED